jgi:hypothetical protein
LIDKVQSLFPGAVLSNGYGTTETGPIGFGPHPDGIPTPPLALGYPMPGVRLRLVDGDNREADKIVFGANLLWASGLPITRTVSIPGCTGAITTGCLLQGSDTVNAEPRGTVELPARYQIDLRFGRLFDLNGQRFELSMDAYNLTNANTVYQVRTGTGLTNIRYANDATQPVTQIATFNSPTQALGPRILRFNVTYWFGGGTSAAANR